MSHPYRSARYNPARKLKVILAGLHVAVITDFSVAYKVVLSIILLFVSFSLQKWIE